MTFIEEAGSGECARPIPDRGDEPLDTSWRVARAVPEGDRLTPLPTFAAGCGTRP
jgi:hypothetical protein